MALRRGALSLLCLSGLQGLQGATAADSGVQRRQDTTATHNNFACRSAIHPNPVIVLHGLGCNSYSCINELYELLGAAGFCTFSATYGVTLIPSGLLLNQIEFGGIKSISVSSTEVAAFIQQVITQTGSSKIDLVGHSEGALMTLYVPKFYPHLVPYISQAIAIAPPTHGSTLSGIYDLAYVLGETSRKFVGTVLQTIDCGACDDLGPEGPAVVQLNQGPIAQPGILYTIIASMNDEFVTPVTTASFVHEPGVRNLYIQQFCPEDHVGHSGLPYDPNIHQLVRNILLGSLSGPAVCVAPANLVGAVVGAVGGLAGGNHDLTLAQPLDRGVKDITGNIEGFK